MATNHHPVAHALVESIGKVPFEDALNRRSTRFGRLIRSRRKPSGPKEKAGAKSIERKEAKRLRTIDTVIAEHEDIIRALKEPPRTSKKPRVLTRWVSRAEVLRKMRSVGFRPHALDVAAALALAHELKKEALQPILNRFSRANGHVRGALFEGTLNNILSAVRMNLVQKIHEVLHENNRAYGTKELAEALKTSPTLKNRVHISDVLGVLDLAGLTYKLPNELKESGGWEYRWIHACHQHSPATIPVWNLDWQILRHLHEQGRTSITTLSKPLKFYGKEFGSAEGKASYESVKESLGRLQKARLIKRESERGSAATLTEYGEHLLKEQNKLDYLHPALRILLLGLPREQEELKPRELRILEHITGWTRIHAALEKERRKAGKEGQYVGVSAVKKTLGLKHSKIQSVAAGRAPWKAVSPDNLQHFYLPLLEKRNPELAGHFRAVLEAWLKEKKRVYRQFKKL